MTTAICTYNLILVCSDIDECENSMLHDVYCSVNETCENELGSFNCQCKLGFIRNNDGGSCEGKLSLYKTVFGIVVASQMGLGIT